MAANKEQTGDDPSVIIDPLYEFSAPQFYDFIDGETEEDERREELWFDSALSYGPSPSMPRVKTRSIKVESLCDFSEVETKRKESESNGNATCSDGRLQPELVATTNEEISDSKASGACLSENHEEQGQTNGPHSGLEERTGLLEVHSSEKMKALPASKVAEVHTPLPQATSKKALDTGSKNRLAAKKVASLVTNPLALKPSQSSQVKCKTNSKTDAAKREINMKNPSAPPNLAQENQAIKRQKLEGGQSRQILNIKPHNLPHKSNTGLSNIGNSAASDKIQRENRKMYIRETPVPYISTAEMIKKFQASTREVSLPCNSTMRGKSKLTLTRPKVPELETSQRIRPVKLKSTAEIEEEIMAKIPKFKARPLNKKILEAPTTPAPQRSALKLPEFQEFHFRTLERANNNAESASMASTETSNQTHEWRPCLTEPQAPTLLTSLRARPPNVKSSAEVEQEELEKAPKFKARPLNKKIFESKGNLGVFCNAKKLVTVPQEFHFATDERFPPPAAMCDIFDKLSLKSQPHEENPLPRKTAPNPFHLHTEERGAEKERRFKTELMQKQLEDEKARIPKASPYPYTTDFPVVPPKPEPKQCTKPEPFQLESLVRHEVELHKEMDERKRMEKEEAEMRIFKAHPILKEDPTPVPEKVRRPLTQVQEFNLQSDHRAMDRAEYDQKINEKEMVHKRLREEIETAKMMEEEKALKQLRRTLVHHAKPVPNFSHPFHPQRSSREVTKAKSPKLRVLRRKDMNVIATQSGVSFTAAATNLR
ncbi:hypothetical protein MLD38_030554 [Melastoma candidum]|uniref:Uncharacterized protein n=1 Tax=Melastoma candidum TaxID=119954 RepID=A0ACB9MM42_9MYRT|nr:hypothetical protein MLD38_030554 [Melastoma candidum]